MCKICGHRHRFRDPHIFAGGKVKALEVAKKAVAAPPVKKAKPKRKARK